MMRLRLLATVALIATGCSGEPGGGDAAVLDGTVLDGTVLDGTVPDGTVPDGASQDGAALDGGSDAGPQSCADQLMNRRIALDRAGPRTQIHPSVLFQDDGVWIVYSRPEPGGGNFDTWATRRACDGTVLIAPFLVQANSEGNDIDPAVAWSGATLLIAWVTDDGTGGTDNLQIHYRPFSADGTPTMVEDAQLTTSRMGALVLGNHTGVKLAPTPDGGFVAAGVRGVPEAMRFLAYAQRIGAAGELLGEALEPVFEMNVTHSNVAIAVAPDGAQTLVYQREPDSGAAQVMVSALDGAAPERVFDGLASSSGPDVGAAGAATWVAFAGDEATEVDLRIVDVSQPLASRTMRSVGVSGRVEHSPRIAIGDGRAAVAFFRQVRGFTNELLLASISDPSIEPVLVESAAPSYQPALTWVMGDYWFVSYAIGDSPDFRLVGSFVRLAPP